MSSFNLMKEKNTQDSILSDAEKRIRSDWRRSLYTYLLGTLAISFGCYIFLAYYGNMELANEVLEERLVGVLDLAIYMAIMFYFAHVRFGTKWIGWFLFVSLIRTTSEGIKYLAETFSLPDLTLTGIYYDLFVYLFSIPLYVYFWIHCKRIYELNSTIKQRKIEKEGHELGLIH